MVTGKKNAYPIISYRISIEPCRIRTSDHRLKRAMLYRLS